MKRHEIKKLKCSEEGGGDHPPIERVASKHHGEIEAFVFFVS